MDAMFRPRFRGHREEQAKRIMEQVPQEPIAADPSENDEAEDRSEDDDDNGPDPGPGVPIFDTPAPA